MISASLYIIVCSTRNRARRWIRRLREPRYLVAVMAGAAYFYFLLRQATRVRGPRVGRPAPLSLLQLFPALAAAGPVLAGSGVLLVAAGSWLFPGTGSLLEFTRAEVHFLFPAPVTRRTLIVYRMLRSQLGVLVSSLIFSLVIPFGSSPRRVRMAMTVWVLLFTARAYFSAVAIARVRMRSDDPRRRRLARLPLTLILLAVVVVVVSCGRALWSLPIASANDVYTRVATVAASGLPRLVLWPFVALVSPLFTPDWTAFLPALARALAVMSAVTVWVLLNDEAFEEVTTEVAERRQDQPRQKKTSYRARNVVWTLAPTGRVETAFAWKGMQQTLRVVEGRVLLRMALVIAWIAVVVSISSRGLAASLGVAAMVAVAISTILGPLILRVDLRQDLQHLELLKTWPMRASALVRGEMLWPACVLTGVAWMMTALAVYLSAAVFSTASTVLRMSIAAGVCLVAPALIAAQLTIHNAAALLFPAWVPLGVWRARGVDAVGQRLILTGGTMLLVALAAAPGALTGGLVWLAFNRFIGPIVIVPAAVACAAVIGVEVLLATEALGPAYERLDVLAVERTE